MFENLGDDFYRILYKGLFFLVVLIIYKTLLFLFRKRKEKEEDAEEN